MSPGNRYAVDILRMRSCASSQPAPATRAQSAQRIHACARFSREVSQLVEALAQCGSQFLPSSRAGISIRELEYAFTAREAVFRVTDLAKLLDSARAEPLSLTEARTLLSSPLLDMLCSILSRLEWMQFCTELEALESPMRGLFLVTSTLDCITELLRTWSRVQPVSDTMTAVKETFERYGRTAREALSTEAGSGSPISLPQVPDRAFFRPSGCRWAGRNGSSNCQDRSAGACGLLGDGKGCTLNPAGTRLQRTSRQHCGYCSPSSAWKTCPRAKGDW